MLWRMEKKSKQGDFEVMLNVVEVVLLDDEVAIDRF
jgi:hypothetical protein